MLRTSTASLVPLVVDEAESFDTLGTNKPASLSSVTEEESGDEHLISDSSSDSPVQAAVPALTVPPIADEELDAVQTAVAAEMTGQSVHTSDSLAEANADADATKVLACEENLGDERIARDCSCCCFSSSKRQGWLESAFAMVTLGIVCGWFYIIGVVELALIVHALVRRSAWSATAAAVLLSSCWWPLNNRYPWRPYTEGWLFRIWRRYFEWSSVVEEKLDPAGRYMFAEMPHGVFPLGSLLSVSVVKHCFPGIQHIAGVAADVVLRIPLIRQLYGWAGIRAVGKGNKTISDMYADGVQVAIVTGGIAEIFLAGDKAAERVYLQQRKGFVKLAIKNGAAIVPIYFFGQSLLFDIVGGGRDDSFVSRVSRKLRSSFVAFYGRGWTTIPYRQPIKMVSGRPIAVEQHDSPSDEYINRIHSELVYRVQTLYETHKPAWEVRPLIIM